MLFLSLFYDVLVGLCSKCGFEAEGFTSIN
jgi:hypothetical protein